MVFKVRLAEPHNFLLKDYNASLTRHLRKLNVELAESDKDDFFIALVHIESKEDLERTAQYKEAGASTIAILHTLEELELFEWVYERRAIDRFIVHHRYFQEIASRELYDSTRIIFHPFPVENPGFTEERGRYIVIPEGANDFEVIGALESMFSIIKVQENQPLPPMDEVALIVMPYNTEKFETIYFLYKLLPLQRPLVLSRIPSFEELAFRELTPEILYSTGKAERATQIVEKLLQDEKLYTYFTYVLRGYVMSYTFYRFSRILKRLFIDITPEEFRSLYVS